jgi:hypothetical protein
MGLPERGFPRIGRSRRDDTSARDTCRAILGRDGEEKLFGDGEDNTDFKCAFRLGEEKILLEGATRAVRDETKLLLGGKKLLLLEGASRFVGEATTPLVVREEKLLSDEASCSVGEEATLIVVG